MFSFPFLHRVDTKLHLTALLSYHMAYMCCVLPTACICHLFYQTTTLDVFLSHAHWLEFILNARLQLVESSIVDVNK